MSGISNPQSRPQGKKDGALVTNKENNMNDEQIKHMVNRFLGWKLPNNFNPDNGISFSPFYQGMSGNPISRDPSGTNLFDANQAEAMIRYITEGIDLQDTDSKAKNG